MAVIGKSVHDVITTSYCDTDLTNVYILPSKVNPPLKHAEYPDILLWDQVYKLYYRR